MADLGLSLWQLVGLYEVVMLSFLLRLMVVRRQRIARRREERFWMAITATSRGNHIVTTEEARVLVGGHVGTMSRRGALGMGSTRLYNVYRMMELVRAVRKEVPVIPVRSSWFHALKYFIPREIRAPWYDHLLEEREEAAAEGRSEFFIEIATTFQILALFARLIWEPILRALTRIIWPF